MVVLILGLMLAAGGVESGKGALPRAESTPLLSGPTVHEAEAAPSLVRFGADGRLLALDDREEILAIDLLGLSEEEREPLDRLIRLRLADLMSGGLKRIPLILELQEATASGEAAKIDDVLMRYARNRPIWGNKVALVEVVANALPERVRGEYRRLVNEYQDAWVAMKARETMKGREELLADLEREKQIADIRRPTEARLEEARSRFEAISKRLDLTTEQEGKLRTPLQEYATNTNYRPTGRDGLKLLSDMFGVLTWEQRAEMAKYLREQRTGERFRPLRDAPKGTGVAAGVPILMLAARRKRRPIP
ncbi:MAG: hypothetical protein KF805_11130 [Phycisphaeraceae bacterium]|nr:hypothetical protein [Phycisphaeraceae bacterium]